MPMQLLNIDFSRGCLKHKGHQYILEITGMKRDYKLLYSGEWSLKKSMHRKKQKEPRTQNHFTYPGGTGRLNDLCENAPYVTSYFPSEILFTASMVTVHYQHPYMNM